MLNFAAPPGSSPRAQSPPNPPSPPPPPPSRMQSRPAAERPNRLSLVPFVQDLDKATVEHIAAELSGPKSHMDWDEEGKAPHRAQQKVRDIFRNAFDRPEKRTAAAAPKAATKAAPKAAPKAIPRAIPKAAQRPNDGAVGAIGHAKSGGFEGVRKGSVRNARIGIEKRRELEVCFQSSISEVIC